MLGVGIIGCGNISAAYLRLSPLFSGYEVRKVADLDMQAARARAAAFEVEAVSVEDLLSAPDIDLIVNLTVPAAHFAVTKRILEAGKHTYSEKPLVLTVDEGMELQRIAGARGLRVGSAPDTFLGGAHQLARATLDEGRIGRVVAGSCHVMSHGMEHWHPNPTFFYQTGAGPVLDVGPYYIANLVQLLGPVRRVAALATLASRTRLIASEPRRGETIEVGTPTNVHALLDFEQGATITFSASWDVWKHRHPAMELYGTDGSLFLPDPNFFGGIVEIADSEGQVRTLDHPDHPFSVTNEEAEEGARANYRAAGLADMVQAIREGRDHRCSLELALHVVEALTSILRSGEEGRFIELTTRCARPAPLDPAQARTLMK